MRYCFAVLLLLLSMSASCLAQGADEKVCTLSVSAPKGMFRGAESAKLVVSVNAEDGDREMGMVELTLKDGKMRGEWKGDGKEQFAASAIWTEDPHVGFSFYVEPGMVVAEAKGEGFDVSGTTLNDTYNNYRKECESMPYSKTDSIAEEYMKRYCDTPLFGMLFASHGSVTFGTDKENVERLWALGGENGKKMKYAQDAYKRICCNDIANGEPLRDVEIPNATVEGDGQSVKLSDYIGKGKWVFVDFWASWCVGCRQAIPLVKKAHELLKDKNIEFISIAEWDKRPAALKAMKEENMPWLQLIDEKGVCGDRYMFNTIPRFMLFAPDGTLAEKDVDRKDIVKLLSEKVEGTK